MAFVRNILFLAQRILFQVRNTNIIHLAQRILFLDNVNCAVFFELMHISDDQSVIKVYIV